MLGSDGEKTDKTESGDRMDANPAFGVQSKQEKVCEGEEHFLHEESSWLLQALLFSKPFRNGFLTVI